MIKCSKCKGDFELEELSFQNPHMLCKKCLKAIERHQKQLRVINNNSK